MQLNHEFIQTLCFFILLFEAYVPKAYIPRNSVFGSAKLKFKLVEAWEFEILNNKLCGFAVIEIQGD